MVVVVKIIVIKIMGHDCGGKSLSIVARREPPHPLNHKFPDFFGVLFGLLRFYFLSSLRMGLTIVYNSLPEQTFCAQELIGLKWCHLKKACSCQIVHTFLSFLSIEPAKPRWQLSSSMSIQPQPRKPHVVFPHLSYGQLVVAAQEWEHFCATDVYSLWR